MKRAISYIRFSKDVQRHGDSLRRQTELRDKWLAAHPDYVLDTSLRLSDLGVSAFRGDHATKGKLGDFLEAVRQGRVPKGSVLLIEALDRLGREELDVVQERFNGILRAGVDIVTLLDDQRYTRQDLKDLGKTLLAVVKMYAAGEESRRKSERLKAGWTERRKKAAWEKMTGVCPAWLRPTWKRLADGSTVGTKDRFEEIPEHVEAVRAIFRWAVEGFGIEAITKKCNTDFPAAGRAMSKKKSGCWTRSYVGRILGNRAVLGEVQPTVRNPKLDDPDLPEKKRRKMPLRVAAGKPVKNYYPATIREDLFRRARQALAGRKWQRGGMWQRGPDGEPTAQNVRNLFTGLLVDARDGRPMNVLPKGRKGAADGHGGRKDKLVLVSAGARRGEAGSKYLSFDYRVFEAAFLELLQELKPADVLAKEDADGEDEVTDLSGQLGELEHKLQTAKAKLRQDPDIETLVDLVAEWEKQMRAVNADLERAKAAKSYDGAEALGTTQGLGKLLADCPPADLADLRLRVKGALRQLVKEVRVLVVPRGTDRLAALQCSFNPDGQRRREYLIWVRAGTANGAKGSWQVTSVRSDQEVPLETVLANPWATGVVPYDLADAKQVQRMEAVLGGTGVTLREPGEGTAELDMPADQGEGLKLGAPLSWEARLDRVFQGCPRHALP
jgi:DNA invertase Pin-like site-specific DNA recombinase